MKNDLSMKLVGEKNKTTYFVQKVTFNDSSQLQGVLECPDMIEPPSENVFTLHPFHILIEIMLHEPKVPKFKVLKSLVSMPSPSLDSES